MKFQVKHIENLRQIFQCSVESVRPKNLLSSANNYNLKPTKIQTDNGSSERIEIQGRSLDITNKRCHVVGFGKAVLGMAVQLERSIDEHLIGGVISIPSGTLKQFAKVDEMLLKENSKIKVYEGAPNNQPDEVALEAAKEIKSYAKRMNSDDILFVLISGGGSALLPLPKHPLNLKEKMELVKALANKGATIQEMNTVRIALSDIKGGRLAAAAKDASAVISFLISDIVGDPVDLIASGPTCPVINKKFTAKQILSNYEIWDSLPVHIKTLVESSTVEEIKPGTNNTIYVVGDNQVATAAAVKVATDIGYNPFIGSTVMQGEVTAIVGLYSGLLRNICAFRKGDISEEDFKDNYPFDSRSLQHFIKTLLMCQKVEKPLLLIMAGEPTVQVLGKGVGGRNQELALRMALEIYTHPELHEVLFLSAGTDGIDGPTPAAGAIGCKQVIEDFLNTSTKDELNKYINNNDSYNFYKDLRQGYYHVITGHTGTNVMDLHCFIIP